MITLDPERSKTLTFNFTFRGMDLSRANTRMIIPINEDVSIIAKGEIFENEIIVKIPALGDNIPETRQTKGTLEIITFDNKYFSPYETQINIIEQAKITSIKMEDEEEEPKKSELIIKSLNEEDEDPPKKVVMKKELKEEKRPTKIKREKSKLAKFLEK